MNDPPITITCLLLHIGLAFAKRGDVSRLRPAGRTFLVFRKTGKTFANLPDFRDAFTEPEKARQNSLKFLLAENCGQNYRRSTGVKDIRLVRGGDTQYRARGGFELFEPLRENVDRRTGSPVREAVQ